MDQNIQKTESSGDQPNITYAFENLYKNCNRLERQEERRRQILENQKTLRQSFVDSSRGILNLVDTFEIDYAKKYKKKISYRPTIYVAGFSVARQTYGRVLMMSEWLVEKPHDLTENWYVLPCPKGRRVLVIAAQGKSKIFSKHGEMMEHFTSSLPGGCKKSINAVTVLDCFHSEVNNTLYVLDLLAWNNQPMTDCEAEFRNYWLHQQFKDQELSAQSMSGDDIKFEVLPTVTCTPENLNMFMMKHPHFSCDKTILDGLLFYHKKAHYMSGQTPLVGWLFPYMVNEVLGEDITVADNYIQEKPSDYVNQAEFIKTFEKAQRKRRTKKKSTVNNMDTADSMNECKSDKATSNSEAMESLDDSGVANEPEADVCASMESEEDIQEPLADEASKSTMENQNVLNSAPESSGETQASNDNAAVAMESEDVIEKLEE